MGEAGGDHRLAGRQRLDQDTGGHLFPGVVGEEHHVGLLDHAAEGRQVEVAGVELDEMADAPGRGAGLEGGAVGLALPVDDPRVGLAHDEVAGSRVEVHEFGQRVDGPFDALARAEEPPGEDGGSPARSASPIRAVGDLRLSGAPWGMRATRWRVDRVAGQEAAAGGGGHDHHGVSGGQDAFQDLALMRGRIDEDRVEHHDDRDGELVEDGEDLIAVRSAVDPVLVLDDHHVESAEDLRRLGLTPRRTGDEVVDNFRRLTGAKGNRRSAPRRPHRARGRPEARRGGRR